VTARSGAHSHKTWQSSASHYTLYCIKSLSLTGFCPLRAFAQGGDFGKFAGVFGVLYKLPVPYGLYRPAGSVTARSGAHSHKTSQSAASHSPLYCIKSLSLTGLPHSHENWQSAASHSNLYCINCLSLTGFVPYGLPPRLAATQLPTHHCRIQPTRQTGLSPA
jgi:hypothetical protein